MKKNILALFLGMFLAFLLSILMDDSQKQVKKLEENDWINTIVEYNNKFLNVRTFALDLQIKWNDSLYVDNLKITSYGKNNGGDSLLSLERFYSFSVVDGNFECEGVLGK